MKLNTLDDLFLCLLSDIYEVENQIIKEIPFLVQRAENEDLKKALNTHLKETKEQVVRLDRIFKIIKKSPGTNEWSSDIRNLFKDAAALLKDNQSSPVLDAAIIAIAQRIEHFEIATYGALCEFAKVLKHDEVYDLLNDTIKEEGHADKLLTKLAEGGVFTKGINVSAVR